MIALRSSVLMIGIDFNRCGPGPLGVFTAVMTFLVSMLSKPKEVERNCLLVLSIIFGNSHNSHLVVNRRSEQATAPKLA
jgi:hypothetical protein